MRLLRSHISRRVTVLAVHTLLLAPAAVAQAVGFHAGEVSITTDPFTDEVMCSQSIWAFTEDGFVFMVSPSTGSAGVITFGFQRERGDPVLGNEGRVLLNIGGEIYGAHIVEAEYLRDVDLDVVFAVDAHDMIRALATAEQPVPVVHTVEHFAPRSNYVMPMEMIEAYADGFARECLD